MPISFHTSGQGEFEVSRQILPCQHYDKQPSNCTLSLVKDKLEYGEWLRVVFKIYLINLESRSVCCLDKIVMVKLQVWPQHACCAASASLLIIPCEGLEDNEMNTEGKVEHPIRSCAITQGLSWSLSVFMLWTRIDELQHEQFYRRRRWAFWSWSNKIYPFLNPEHVCSQHLTFKYQFSFFLHSENVHVQAWMGKEMELKKQVLCGYQSAQVH